MRPASTLLRSRMSFTRCKRCVPLSWMLLAKRRRWAPAGPSPGSSSISSENPMIEFSGVRNSWLIVARNSLLARVARASAALLSSRRWRAACSRTRDRVRSSSARLRSAQRFLGAPALGDLGGELAVGGPQRGRPLLDGDLEHVLGQLQLALDLLELQVLGQELVAEGNGLLTLRALGSVELLQLRCHRVEPLGQLADLIAVAYGKRPGEVAPRDSRELGPHRADRRGDAGGRGLAEDHAGQGGD